MRRYNAADMSSHPFRIVNVFTQDHGSLTGNPLCVFEHAADFDTATMQALALQFNLSETTFISPSTVGDARVRIFTPTYEMGFAGHPTLGTAHVCRALGLGGDSLRLEMQAGLISVMAHGSRWTLAAPAATWRELDVPVASLALALGLDKDDIGERPLWVRAGIEQLIVPLRSADAVRRVSPRAEAFVGIQSDRGHSMAYVFASTGVERILARFFFPQGPALLEDPATGSATANFGAWCVAMGQPLPLHHEISQGAMVGRPSTLHLDVGRDNEIRVSGDVVELARGVVTL
jgi:PhzF family phenazine biosynthesis protein